MTSPDEPPGVARVRRPGRMGLCPEPYTNRVKSQGVMRSRPLVFAEGGRPAHQSHGEEEDHVWVSHTKRLTAENFLKNRVVASTPHTARE